MSQIVYLNVGGQIFETTEDTLLRSPYFSGIKNVNGSIKTSKEEPYFIDRDPKLFRHILNLLRNPKYEYPYKYYSELKFYSLIEEQIKDNQEPICEINFDSFDKNYNRDLSRLYKLIKTTPDVTFHRTIYRRSTYCLYYLQAIQFSTMPIDYDIQRIGLISDLYFLIPKIINLDDLATFEVQIIINNEYSIKYSLEVSPFINKHKIVKIDGYYYIPLYFMKSHQPKLCFQSLSTQKINVQIKSSKYSDLVTYLKFRFSEVDAMESAKLENMNYQSVVSEINEAVLEHKSYYNLKRGYCQFLLWSTDKKIDFINLKNKITDTNYELSRGDFQYLERDVRNVEKLPDKLGSMYFCLFPLEYDADSGGIWCGDDDYILEFPQEVNGKVWQFNTVIMEFKNGHINVIR